MERCAFLGPVKRKEGQLLVFSCSVVGQTTAEQCRTCLKSKPTGQTLHLPRQNAESVPEAEKQDRAKQTHSRNCGGARMGLGDMVAGGLSMIGITKERVSAIVGHDCGCGARQQKLNELGKRIGIGR